MYISYLEKVNFRIYILTLIATACQLIRIKQNNAFSFRMSTHFISIIWIFYIDEIIAQQRRWHVYSFYFTGYAINFAQIFQEKTPRNCSL